MTGVVVLLSGGIDSAVLLATHIKQQDRCTAITFDYGQTHRQREIAAACVIAAHYQVEHRVIDLTGIFAGSALTGHAAIPAEHAEALDATYVPARNLVMLSIGAAIAEQVKAAAVVFGANRDDRGGYPDCRQEFVAAINDAAGLGTARGISISAPFVSYTKREIVTHGLSIGVPIHRTWSCYRDQERPCRSCGACLSRAAALP